MQELEKAPLFKAKTLNGDTLDLGQLYGHKVLLVFFRYATCPLCNLRAEELRREYESLRRDYIVIGVFQSDPEYIREYIGSRGIPFPIIPDPEGDLYRMYGVEHSWWKLWLGFRRVKTVFNAFFRNGWRPGPVDGVISRIPADFLIDEFGRLMLCHYGSDITDHVPLARLSERLEEDRILGLA
ncbi:hypothetical protein BW247_03055 [Acidihalobacter ferrooxydans]|uniref:Thioredoxin domain-containing protein n=1 Tax=Acidihalobacter ferrooxydans TaxID=1765967 RepID=A0A1P8UEG1_9GAMM|nr:hypothetical protein BW247_03055 [Acidihalobacter ferrooxydans]